MSQRENKAAGRKAASVARASLLGLALLCAMPSAASADSLWEAWGDRWGSAEQSTPVKRALSYLGAPYQLGGLTARGIDCSALTQRAWDGIADIPRTAKEQASFGKRVAKSDLREGDLVFFRKAGSKEISHVGVYIGGGKFTHASQAEGKVVVSSLRSGHWVRNWAGARRPAQSNADELRLASANRQSSRAKIANLPSPKPIVAKMDDPGLAARAIDLDLGAVSDLRKAARFELAAVPPKAPESFARGTAAEGAGGGDLDYRSAKTELAGIEGVMAASNALTLLAEGTAAAELPRKAWSGLLDRELPSDFSTLASAGRAVPRSRIADGDLMLFREGGRIAVIGVYIGSGQFAVGGRDGGVLSLSDSDWASRLAGVRRVAPRMAPPALGNEIASSI